MHEIREMRARGKGGNGGGVGEGGGWLGSCVSVVSFVNPDGEDENTQSLNHCM